MATVAQSQQLVRGAVLPLNERYHSFLASTNSERESGFRLRFEVFNLELKEGLESAYVHGLDRDDFDDICEHLLVEDARTGQIVGTYRMQSGDCARSNWGYYSEREFDFRPYEAVRSQVLELGRACVHRDHRNFDVLNLLWKGVARYAEHIGARYLIGCSSLTSQDAIEGWQVYNRISKYLCQDELRTCPKAEFALDQTQASGELDPPKLLRAYLAIGAKICGPPAIDREFKTIDFLTLLDLHTLPASIRSRYLSKR